jgi:predicted DNA-binding transcriptional regulator YafY
VARFSARRVSTVGSAMASTVPPIAEQNLPDRCATLDHVLETSVRLLRLLSLLQARREWSGTDLADRLEVSTRTVRHDVDRLRSLGYPVHGSRGVGGGYRLGAGAALPPLLLDDEEAVAVAVGLRTAARGAVAGIEETSLRALAKLEQVLPSRLRRRVNAVQTYTVPIPVDSPGPLVDPDLLATLAAACRDGVGLRLSYRSHGGEGSRRTVEPHRLVSWGRRWYLVAWDLDRDDWRTFRVDRIDPAVRLGVRFTPRQDPEGGVAAYVARGVSAAAWRHRVRITLHAPGEAIADRISPAVGVVEAVDASTCILDTGAESLETVAVWIAFLGVDFTVTEPPELVAQVRALAARYARATD